MSYRKQLRIGQVRKLSLDTLPSQYFGTDGNGILGYYDIPTGNTGGNFVTLDTTQTITGAKLIQRDDESLAFRNTANNNATFLSFKNFNNVDRAFLGYRSSGNTNFSIGLTSNDAFTVITDSTERFIITGNGSVGIGTGIPSALFEIANSSDSKTAIFARSSGDTNFNVNTFQLKTGSSVIDGIVGGIGLDYANSNTNARINFHRGGSVTGGYISMSTGDNTERFRINANGNTRISSSNPVFEIVDSISNRRWGLNVIGSAPSAGFFQIADFTSNQTRLIIDTNGNVGIGTLTPSTLLHVGGQITATQSNTVNTVVTGGRLVQTGNGLTGGGNLTADRTLTLGTPSTISVASANSVGVSTHNHTLDLSGRSLTAGNGLTGGGNLGSNLTFTLGNPSTIGNGSTNSVGASTHSHAVNLGISDIPDLSSLYVTAGRTISTTAGLTGGGDLTANRTLGIAIGGVTPAQLATNTIVTVNITAGTGFSSQAVAESTTFTRNIVYLRGTFTRTGTNSGGGFLIGIIPVGYRPRADQWFYGITDVAGDNIRVSTNGDITFFGTVAAPKLMYVNGISYIINNI